MLGWGAFWQILANGVAYSTVGYWGVPVVVAGAGWIALSTPNARLRYLLLSLPMLGILNLLSVASIAVVSDPPRSWILWVPILSPLFALVGHALLLLPDDASRAARVLWAAANLTLVVRSTIFVGSHF